MKWSKRDTIALFNMRDRERLTWKAIGAAFPGRTAAACQVRYYQFSKPATAPAAVAPVAIAQAKATPPGRTISTAALIADNELRTRIAILGATGGLLGDPMPGRSALDEKRASGAA
jgi:hypothetical protein